MLRMSPKSELGEMLVEHKAEVFEWLAERADVPSTESSSNDEDTPMKD